MTPPGARTRRSAALAGAVCVGLTAALAACTGDPGEDTNGVGELPAAKIEMKARKAAERADAVKVSGKVVSKGTTYRLSMRLKRDGGRGEVATSGGDTFTLLRDGDDLYLKADAGFWKRQEKDGGKSSAAAGRAARNLEDKYVKVPHGDPAYRQLSGFTDMHVLLDGLLAMNGERETGDEGEIEGVKTVRVTAGGGAGGVIDVSLIGTPYPLRLERGGNAGTLRLQDWNKDFTLKLPGKDQVVDYGKRISASATSGG